MVEVIFFRTNSNKYKFWDKTIKATIHNSSLAPKEKTIVVSKKIIYEDIYKNCISMKEKFCSTAIKVGKKPWAVQLSLSKYKQFSSNINGEVIEILIKIDS